MKKEDIRRIVRTRKKLLTKTERDEAASAVFSRIEKLNSFIQAKHILLYHSLPDELPTHTFINKWHRHKCIYLPRINGEDLDILPYSPQLLQTGAFNIMEPSGHDTCDIGIIDLIVVPAVAYDSHCNRVGRGKGYYDRLLSRTKAIKIGIAYEFQLFDDIETAPFDIPMDIVITESHIFNRITD